MSAIIEQGNAEGTFSVGSPDTARVIVTLLQGAQDLAGELFFARQANAIPFDAVESSFGAHAEAFERILGIAPGSVTLIDGPPLRVWYG